MSLEIHRLVMTFHGNVSKRLRRLARDNKENQATILGREGLDKGMLWAIKGKRKNPRLSTLLRLAKSVGCTTPEEFATLFYANVTKNEAKEELNL
jgi:transcriptional regulator with XRE-family HTH domain